jgi:hypothetical protein
MTPASVAVLAAVTAVAAAVRSTWSPCGLSVLSSITPLAERGRGRRFALTASWFVAGAALGGATLGVGGAALAAAVGAARPAAGVVGGLAAGAAALAAAVDAGLLGPLSPPHHRRQVNELWLNRYRGWVVGVGFGWQIGSGLATYIMTAGVYLLVALAALTAEPPLALATGVLFGTVRGLAVLLVAGVETSGALASFHRRFDAARRPVRRAVVAVEAGVAVAAAALTWGPAGGAAAAGAVLAATAARPLVTATAAARRARPQPAR